MLVVLVAAALGATWAAPSPASADGPTRGRIIATGDHFQPGETMPIVGADLDGDLGVTFRLISGTTTAEVGRGIVNADGSLSASAIVPPSFPRGYAELTVTDDNGTTWSTIVLIGDRAEGPGGAAAGSSLDERSIALILVGVGLAIFVAASLVHLRGARGTGKPG